MTNRQRFGEAGGNCPLHAVAHGACRGRRDGGFVLIGLGAANVVPVLFRRAGSQKAMPPGLAIAALTWPDMPAFCSGPAVIGFVAKHVGLTMAFWMISAILLMVRYALPSSLRSCRGMIHPKSG